MKNLNVFFVLCMLLNISSAFAQEDTSIQTPDESPALRRGADENGVFAIGSEDNVNLANGSLSVSLPLSQSYKLHGELSYQFSLNYSSNAWDYQVDSCYHSDNADLSNPYYVEYNMPIPNPFSNAGLGWELNFGRLLEPTTGGEIDVTPFRPLHFWVYVDKTGARRTFNNSLFGLEQGDATKFTSDGSFIRMTEAENGSGVRQCSNPPTMEQSPRPEQCRRLEFPDGQIHEFHDVGYEDLPIWRVTQIKDRKGNFVKFTYQDQQWHIRDSVGRNHRVDFNTAGQITLVKTAKYDGGTNDYTFETSSRQVQRHKYGPLTSALRCPGYTHDDQRFPSPGNAEDYAQVTWPFLNRLTMPDSSYYEFDYGSTDSYVHTDLSQWAPPNAQAGESSGSLKSLRGPTGLRKEWTYGRYIFPHFKRVGHFTDGDGQQINLPSTSSDISGIFRKDHYVRNSSGVSNVRAARWLYEHSSEGVAVLGASTRPCFFKSIMTDPANRRTVRYFNGNDLDGIPSGMLNLPFATCATDGSHGVLPPPYVSSEHFDANGHLFKRVWVEYEEMGRGHFFDVDNQLVYRKEELFNPNPNNSESQIRETWYEDYDGLGHFRTQVSDSDYWENIGADNLKITEIQINPGSNRVTRQVPRLNEAWMLNRPTSTTISNGSGDYRRTDMCYEDDDSNQWTGMRKFAATEIPEGQAVVPPSNRDEVSIRTINHQGDVIRERLYGGDDRQLPDAYHSCASDVGMNPSYDLVHRYQHGMVYQSTYKNGSTDALRLFHRVIDRNSGLITQMTDQYGVVTNFSYDIMGRLFSQQTANEAKLFARYNYPTQTNPSKENRAVYRICDVTQSGSTLCGTEENPSGLIVRDEYIYDDRAQLVEEIKHLPGGQEGRKVSKKTRYDASGRKTQESDWYPTAGSPVYWTTFQGYDYMDRPTVVKLPDQRTTNYIYSGDWFKQTHYEVMVGDGPIGAMETAVAQGFMDGFGRKIRARIKRSSNGDYLTTTQNFNVSDQLILVCRNDQSGMIDDHCQSNASTPPHLIQQSRTFSYDGRGRLLESTMPEQGTIRYSYDAAGLVVTQDYPGGDQHDLAMIYDAAGRLIRTQTAEVSNPTILNEFYYAPEDDATRGWVKNKVVLSKRHNFVVIDGAEQNIVISDAYRFNMNGQKRMTERQTRANTQRGIRFLSDGFVYNNTGNMLSENYPTCMVSGCESSVPGLVVQKDFAQMALVGIPGYLESITYTDRGTVHSLAHQNDTTTTYHQNAATWSPLSRVTVDGPGGQTLWDSGQYAYDSGGNITAIGDQQYRYDLLGRMRYGEVRIHGETGSEMASQYVQFDDFNNITSLTNFNAVDSGPADVAIDPLTNRLDNGPERYDSQGRLTATTLGAKSFAFDYDPLSMIRQLSTDAGDANLAYLYNANNQRVATLDLINNQAEWTIRGTGGYVQTVFKSDQIMAPMLEFTQREQDYIYAGSKQVVSVTQDGVRHFHSDHLGSTRLITNEASAVVSEHDYLPFGGYTRLPQIQERLQFTGHERDVHSAAPHSDLDYMMARYYSPHVARFLSPDPAHDGWNLYGYVGGNPMNGVDPSGFAEAGWAINLGIVEYETTRDTLSRKSLSHTRNAINRERVESYRFIELKVGGKILISRKERLSEVWGQKVRGKYVSPRTLLDADVTVIEQSHGMEVGENTKGSGTVSTDGVSMVGVEHERVFGKNQTQVGAGVNVNSAGEITVTGKMKIPLGQPFVSILIKDEYTIPRQEYEDVDYRTYTPPPSSDCAKQNVPHC